jgi:hypothetical protein
MGRFRQKKNPVSTPGLAARIDTGFSAGDHLPQHLACLWFDPAMIHIKRSVINKRLCPISIA